MFEIAGLSVVALIVGLIEGLKRTGLNRKWALPVAVGLGLLFTLSWQAASAEPAARPWIEAYLNGIAVGLSACGLYGGVKALVR